MEEVAQTLRVSRATVYRALKRAEWAERYKQIEADKKAQKKLPKPKT